MDSQLSLAIKKYAAVAKVEDVGVAFLRRVNRNGQGQLLDGDMGWLSFHVAGGDNWQRALRNKEDTLVFRLPSPAQWEEDALPELEALAEPFVELGSAMMQNPDKIPYMIYYIDDLLATFDNEFDCSGYTRAANAESDVLAGLLGVSSIQDASAEFCVNMNRDIVQVLQNDDVVDVMEAVRDYVTEMNSPSGQAEFEQIFGSIF